MREAVIVTQSRSMTPGSYMPPIDSDQLKSWNPFKKTRAEQIKSRLKEAMKEEELEFEVSFDYTMGDLRELKMDDVAFYILTPFVSEYVELDVLEEREYIVLTEREYDEADINRIIRKIKWMEAEQL